MPAWATRPISWPVAGLKTARVLPLGGILPLAVDEELGVGVGHGMSL
jgi:hypothetical protein